MPIVATVIKWAADGLACLIAFISTGVVFASGFHAGFGTATSLFLPWTTILLVTSLWACLRPLLAVRDAFGTDGLADDLAPIPGGEVILLRKLRRVRTCAVLPFFFAGAGAAVTSWLDAQMVRWQLPKGVDVIMTYGAIMDGLCLSAGPVAGGILHFLMLRGLCIRRVSDDEDAARLPYNFLSLFLVPLMVSWLPTIVAFWCRSNP